ncbi:hypothetical protein ACFQX6_23500 [Streptosporangium lutulentum]
MQQTATVATQPRLSPMAGPVPAVRRGSPGDEAIVLVIPGRKRYHVAGCRQLVGRDHEELTREEAREEGFTPCTTCLPDSTAGTRPQDAPAGAQEPTRPLVSSQESGSLGAAPEPGPHDSTARFTSPYKPVSPPAEQESSPAGQESPAAGRETSPVGQETSPRPEAVTPSRPYAQPSAQSRSQEPVSPPQRAEQPAAPALPFLSPSVPEIPPAESEAPSWFNRDAFSPSASDLEVPADPDPEPVTSGSPAESASGSSTAAETLARSEAPARSEASTGTEPVTPEASGSETAEPGKPRPEAAGSEPVKPETSGPEPAEPETSRSEPVKPGSATSETSPATGEAPQESSAVKGKAPVASAEPAEDVADPVEPAETAPGRAGRPVPSGPTSAAGSDEAEEKVSFEDRDDDDTSPGGIPIVWVQPDPEDPETGPEPKRETVRVIAGTRRFHDSSCPLVKGMGGSGVETMSQAEAEEAGLSGCPVCLSDH